MEMLNTDENKNVGLFGDCKLNKRIQQTRYNNLNDAASVNAMIFSEKSLVMTFIKFHQCYPFNLYRSHVTLELWQEIISNPIRLDPNCCCYLYIMCLWALIITSPNTRYAAIEPVIFFPYQLWNITRSGMPITGKNQEFTFRIFIWGDTNAALCHNVPYSTWPL